MRHATIAMICLLLSVIGAAHASCVAHSAPTRAHLVELFTSEGCSDCPPADAWLRGLRPTAQIQPLEWHVDYWDSLGWPDRFDDPRYTARQKEIAARSRKPIVYTPEVALDGREWRDWAHGNVTALASTAASLQLTLHVTPGKPLHVFLQSTPTRGMDEALYRAYFVVTEDGLRSGVRAGENRGVTLLHDHTVRALAGPMSLAHAQAALPLPPDLDLARAAVVAFVQDPASGAVAQTVRQAMVECR